MPEGVRIDDPKLKAENARRAFEQEFERFARFRSGVSSDMGLTLKSAETLQRELSDLKTHHTGKKSELATIKKMIGRVAPEERAAFGQIVQQLEASIAQAIEEAS